MRILIVDDHAFVRRGIKEILEEDGIATQVGEAGDASQAMQLLRKGGWELVLLDLGLNGRRGVDVLKDIRSEFPTLAVLIVSGYPEEQYALRMISAGAQGYLNKDTAPEDLVKAVRLVAGGRHYMSEKVTQLMADDYAQGLIRDQSQAPHLSLSNREFEVFLGLASGVTLTQLSNTMGISIKTVSSYRRRVLDKMGMKVNTELAVYASLHGLLDHGG